MFEESVQIWASMNSWFTPTVLFVLLNVIIGTIAYASNLGTTQKHQDPQQHQQGLARSPSMLQRLKSINLYNYRSPEPYTTTFENTTAFEIHPDTTESTHYALRDTHEIEEPQFTRSPSLLQRLKSINLYNYRSPEPHSTTFEKHPETTESTHYAVRHTHELEEPQFTRSPSLLQRLKSINFYIPQDNFSTNPPQPITTTAPLHKTHEPESHFDQATDHHDQFEDEDFDENHEYPEEAESEEEQSLDEIFSQLKPLDEHHVDRTKSDTKPASGEVPTKLPKKMKKSASSKSAFSHFQADDIVEARRPATVKERKVAKVTEDEEVDAKADDFINKFKHQLKLQRLDSFIRYKDMITRGSS